MRSDDGQAGTVLVGAPRDDINEFDSLVQCDLLETGSLEYVDAGSASVFLLLPDATEWMLSDKLAECEMSPSEYGEIEFFDEHLFGTSVGIEISACMGIGTADEEDLTTRAYLIGAPRSDIEMLVGSENVLLEEAGRLYAWDNGVNIVIRANNPAPGVRFGASLSDVPNSGVVTRFMVGAPEFLGIGSADLLTLIVPFQ